jgi:hypothetical protein
MTYRNRPPENVLEDLARGDIATMVAEVAELRAQLERLCATIVTDGVSAEKIELTRMLEAALLHASRELEAVRHEDAIRARMTAFARLNGR